MKKKSPPTALIIIAAVVLAAGWVTTMFHYTVRPAPVPATTNSENIVTIPENAAMPNASPESAEISAAPVETAAAPAPAPTPEPAPVPAPAPEAAPTPSPAMPVPMSPPADEEAQTRRLNEMQAAAHAARPAAPAMVPMTAPAAANAPAMASPQKPARHITAEERSNLQNELRDISEELARANIYISAGPDPESREYAREFAGVFASSGVKVIAMTTESRGRGLFIKVRDKNDPSKEAQLMLTAFRLSGFVISFISWENDDADSKSVALVVGHN